MKKMLWVVFLFLSILFQRTCFAQNAIGLEQLIQEALESNPLIAASRYKTNAFWERPAQAGAWEDPKLTFGIINLPTDDFDFNEQDMTQKTISISQQIPFPGITSFREKSAIEEAKSSENELANINIIITMAVKKTYYQMAFVAEAIKTTEKNEDLLKRFVELTQAKYEVGEGLQEDILKAEVEHSKIKEKLINLNQQQSTLRAEINKLLNRPTTFAIEGRPELRITETDLNKKELEETAIRVNPVLIALKHLVKSTEAQHKLAKKMYFPSFTVTASYGQRDDRRRAKPSPTRVTAADGSFSDVTTLPLDYDKDRPDFFSFLVGINVPIWFKSKQNKRVSETYHRIHQIQSQYESKKNDIFFKISDLTARANRGKELINLYKNSIIPQAEQSLNADMAAYQVAKIDFLALLDSQITLFDYEIQYQKVISDYEKDLAELEAVVGKRLF